MRAAGGPGFVNGLLAFLHPPHLALCGHLESPGWANAAAARLPALVWLACNAGLLALIVRRVRDVSRLTREQTLAAVIAVAAFFPIFETLAQGQLSLLLAVAAFGLASALDQGRPWRAAVWLLVLGFKPQLVPAFAAALLARREWRALGAVAALGAAVLVSTSVVLGPHVSLDGPRRSARASGASAAARQPPRCAGPWPGRVALVARRACERTATPAG